MSASKRKCIGIDLGTTNCCVAVEKNGTIEIISNKLGETTTPSRVIFNGNEVLVDEDPQTCDYGYSVYDIKKLIGRNFTDNHVQTDRKYWNFDVSEGEDYNPVITLTNAGCNKSFSPEEIYSKLLEHLKELSEEFLGENVTDAVITVPAFFNHSQRIATKKAAELAGLNVLRLLNEPTAAAIAYFFNEGNRPEDDRNVLIFDLGGGTFDVTVVEMKHAKITVKATCGTTNLGGKDFDRHLAKYIFQKLKAMEVDVTNSRVIQQVMDRSNKVKHELSAVHSSKFHLDAIDGEESVSLTVTRQDFENANVYAFSKTIDGINYCLSDAKLQKSDIDEVVLVGGSTKIPKINQLVKEFFEGAEKIRAINFDEPVAYGAAVEAAKFAPVSLLTRKIDVIDIASLSFGISIRNESMDVVIPRNTKIPVSKTHTLSTNFYNQTEAVIDVFEGERFLAFHNSKIGTCTVTLPSKSTEHGIKLKFHVDVNGILQVSAEERHSSLKTVFDILHPEKTADILTREESIEDEKLKQLASTIDELHIYCTKISSLCCHDEEPKLVECAEEHQNKLERHLAVFYIESKERDMNKIHRDMYNICEPILNKYGYKVKDIEIQDFCK